MADRVVIQCTLCGFITAGRETLCPRCAGSLLNASVVTGTTTGRGSTGRASEAAPGRSPIADLPPYEEIASSTERRGRASVVGVGAVLLLLAVAAAVVGFVVYDAVRTYRAKSAARAELRRILAAQPDFHAIGEGAAGSTLLGGPMIQKGDRLYMTLRLPRSQVFGDRTEAGLAEVGLIVGEQRAPVYVIPEARAFGPLATGSRNRPLRTLREEFSTILSFADAEVEVVGNENVSGYAVRTYKVVDPSDRSNCMYVSVAPGLRNLVVKCSIKWSDDRFEEDLAFVLSEVSFQIADAALEVPSGYTRVAGG